MWHRVHETPEHDPYLACGVDSSLPPGLDDPVPAAECCGEHVALAVHGGNLVRCGLKMLLGGCLAPGLEVARDLGLVFLLSDESCRHRTSPC